MAKNWKLELKDKKDLGNVYADAAYMYKECFDEIVKRQKKGAKVFMCLSKLQKRKMESVYRAFGLSRDSSVSFLLN